MTSSSLRGHKLPWKVILGLHLAHSEHAEMCPSDIPWGSRARCQRINSTSHHLFLLQCLRLSLSICCPSEGSFGLGKKDQVSTRKTSKLNARLQWRNESTLLPQKMRLWVFLWHKPLLLAHQMMSRAVLFWQVTATKVTALGISTTCKPLLPRHL